MQRVRLTILRGRFQHAIPAALLSALVLAAAPHAHSDILGTPRVISGDMLEVDGRRIRLHGVAAPVAGQTCRAKGQIFDCHRISATALMDLTAGTTVRCVPKREEPDGVLVATCYAGGYDLAEGMAYTGWALAYPRTDNPYLKFEEPARRATHGLWRGEFTPPWQWTSGGRAN